MQEPNKALTAVWAFITLLPLPALLAHAYPSLVGVAFLLQAAFFFGSGYLLSGALGYGSAFVGVLAIAAAQLGLRFAALGSFGLWWATIALDLSAALGGALLWRWRVRHYGADFHFDLIAPWYERFIHPQDPTPLLEDLRLTPEDKVLDVGGGTGRVAQFLTSARQVVVADISVAMLRMAHKKDGVQAVASRSEELPFPEATFERVVMVDALHHVFEQRRTALEMWRVLASGGRLVIEEPDFTHPWVKVLAMWEKSMLMRSHFLTPEAIAAFFPPEARVEIVRRGWIGHIIVTKP